MIPGEPGAALQQIWMKCLAVLTGCAGHWTDRYQGFATAHTAAPAVPGIAAVTAAGNLTVAAAAAAAGAEVDNDAVHETQVDAEAARLVLFAIEQEQCQ